MLDNLPNQLTVARIAIIPIILGPYPDVGDLERVAGAYPVRGGGDYRLARRLSGAQAGPGLQFRQSHGCHRGQMLVAAVILTWPIRGPSTARRSSPRSSFSCAKLPCPGCASSWRGQSQRAGQQAVEMENHAAIRGPVRFLSSAITDLSRCRRFLSARPCCGSQACSPSLPLGLFTGQSQASGGRK